MFAYLVFIGIKGLKAQTIHIFTFCAVTVIFILLSLHILYIEASLGYPVLLAWVIGIIVGIPIGLWHSSQLYLAPGPTPMTVKIKGSALILIAVLIIFSSRYYFGYVKIKYPEQFHGLSFASSMIFIYGICTGFPLGRFLYFLAKIKHLWDLR